MIDIAEHVHKLMREVPLGAFVRGYGYVTSYRIARTARGTYPQVTIEDGGSFPDHYEITPALAETFVKNKRA